MQRLEQYHWGVAHPRRGSLFLRSQRVPSAPTVARFLCHLRSSVLREQGPSSPAVQSGAQSQRNDLGAAERYKKQAQGWQTCLLTKSSRSIRVHGEPCVFPDSPLLTSYLLGGGGLDKVFMATRTQWADEWCMGFLLGPDPPHNTRWHCPGFPPLLQDLFPPLHSALISPQ